MAKQGEIGYLTALGAGGRQHAKFKPYSDPDCGVYMTRVGQMMDLLPAAPARVLELGCGTGWVSVMLARRGYDVVGRDIAPEMIDCANELKDAEGLDNIDFAVADYESLEFPGEFDAVVFFDSLHHAEDERLALSEAFDALRPGGVCVLSEPGVGHSRTAESLEAMARFGVNEKDMPPKHVRGIAFEIGFRHVSIYPHMGQLMQLLSARDLPARAGFRGWVLDQRWSRPILVLMLCTVMMRRTGVVTLTK